MSSVFGFSSLIIALISSLTLVVSEIFKKLSLRNFNNLILCSTLFILLSFFSLVYAYITSDFSNFNVFENSHSTKPLIYKISGSWGNHEGSMLMWICIMSLYACLFSFEKKIDENFKRSTLLIQNILILLFLLFIVFSSNPFLVNSIIVEEGLGLNPILQDPALAIHPPMLYAGYVGYSIVFSLAIAGLFLNKIDKEWVDVSKKWSLLSWTLLTGGIALGSYWAYYELGWGGWWFWDPVENISLMPWIAGIALVHSLFMAKGEYLLKRWIIFLSIFCFSLSVFGTFLVRSGILTSVHSFATDVSRGLFILLIFFLITGFGFLVFLIRAPKNNKPIKLMLFNKTSALIINNILMIIAVTTILLGTIYPIIIEVLTNTRISVGGPYFNSTVIPILLPGFLIMSVAPVLSWQSNKINKYKYYIIVFLLLSLTILFISLLTLFNPWGFLGISLGTWIIIASILSVILNYKFSLRFIYLKKINAFIAHIGVGLLIVGITSSSVYNNESNHFVKEGDEIKIGNTLIIFEEVLLENKENFQSLRANFLIYKNNINIGKVAAGKNYYHVSKIVTTEAGILHEWFRDLYIVLGNENNSLWFVKIYNNPLVSLIWIGSFIMIISGLVGISKR